METPNKTRVRNGRSTVACAECGTVVERHHYRAVKMQYCSRACSTIAAHRARWAPILEAGQMECRLCASVQPLGSFYRRGEYYRTECRPCMDAKAKRWRKKNPARYKQIARGIAKRIRESGRASENARAYAKKNPIRVQAYTREAQARRRGADGRFGEHDVVRLWHGQRGACTVCGVRFGKRPSDKGFHIDHITPVSKGGSNWPHNLQLLCASCNSSKGAKWPVEHRLMMLFDAVKNG